MNQIAKPARSLVVPFLASALLGLTVGATVLVKAVPAHTAETTPGKPAAAKTDKIVSRTH